MFEQQLNCPLCGKNAVAWDILLADFAVVNSRYNATLDCVEYPGTHGKEMGKCLVCGGKLYRMVDPWTGPGPILQQ